MSAGSEQVEPSERGTRAAKRSERLARQIVQDIVARGLPVGAKLPAEAVMIEQLGVARATLREALRLLEVQGLIEIRPGPGGGPVVAGARSLAFGRTATLFFQMRGATFRELNEARQVLEPLMARLAAERQDGAGLRRLAGSVDAGRAAIIEDDLDWAQSSSDFHGVLTSMSGNRVLDLFVESLKEVWFDRVSGSVYEPEERERVRSEHETIADAITRGDGARAEALMTVHMQELTESTAARFPGILDEVIDWR